MGLPVTMRHDTDDRRDVRVEEIIGRRITWAREGRQISQAELGQELASYLGKPWSRQAVSAAEKGGRAFTAVELIALARALEVPVDRLLSPPADVDEIEMPSGQTVDRTQLRAAVGARLTTASLVDSMSDSLRILGKIQQQRREWDGIEVKTLSQLQELFDMVAEQLPDKGNDEDSQ